MMNLRARLLTPVLAALIGGGLACSAPRTDVDLATGGLKIPPLAFDGVGNWAAHIAPRSDELSFESVGWIPDFMQGLVAADAAQRPLFFWAMNGHPLGCT